MYLYQERPGPGSYKLKREFDSTPTSVAPGKLKFAKDVVPLHPPFLSQSKVCTIIIVIMITAAFMFRPPDIVVGRLRFHHDSSIFFYLLYFSSATTRAQGMGLNQNWPHARK